MLEAGYPWSSEEVALALLEYKLTQENMSHRQIQHENGAPEIYRPEEKYAAGHALIFPVLGGVQGEVIAVRNGFNPANGEFRVIAVACDDECTREFVSAMPDHVLNTNPSGVGGSEPKTIKESAQKLLCEHSPDLQTQIENELRARGDIVRLAGYWYPRDLLSEINSGYLNLVEAALDVAGVPLTPDDILTRVGIDDVGERQLMLFSLNYALQQDERFDEVGAAGQVLWFLHGMEPAEILFPPERLRCLPVEASAHVLTPELEQLAWRLHDEFSPQPEIQTVEGPVELVLTYPHWRLGTLPLSVRTAHIFPTALISPRINITLRDELSGEQLPGWVVQRQRFVSGLRPLYEKYAVPSGARITLLPGDEPSEAVVSIERRNPVNEWVRTVMARDAELQFGITQRAVSVSYVDEQIIAVDDTDAVEAAWLRMQELGTTLDKIVLLVFRELAKLTPQGTVHAKTLYSAVNVVRRTPPEPIFAELLRCSCYRHVGDAYWIHEPDTEESYAN